ncbi:unnamed protein product [Angiostrongylus costaricensis]|uniref:Retrotrans_gag domain-containing protein n=1 Tax=Angiostrongylus costaricensis TaxID=334426 RepID=A0A0R3PNC7_ANGCS|nr:unnamed protein product [Angiostrongylus costaricensis]
MASRHTLSFSTRRSTTNSGKDEAAITAVAKNPELPTIPIPTFNGNIWDWYNFWELFNLNLQKFNYLLSSLKGEPLQSMKKFQLTRQNRAKAIEFLTNKYSNSEELIRQLLRKMDKISLHSSSIQEQRKLLEAIIGQLVQKGEYVDNQSTYQKVLSNPVGIQRKVLYKKITSPDEPFIMQQLLKYFEEVITSEELVCRQTTSTPPRDTVCLDNKVKYWRSPTTKLLCMYCKGDLNTKHLKEDNSILKIISYAIFAPLHPTTQFSATGHHVVSARNVTTDQAVSFQHQTRRRS